ncbi:type IX secretion system outer membrane channel protein PorV [Chitinophaga solisilvae]|uniref:Type IX secretion system outer membrane channel protein PorV n=1 Tax=Chitinophaga solisilvae TaxID=1233460 RepID=A0A433WJX2_9BACT|nr:type IX secretion system outer membrane channel protein PorV [Chitinophaga solisilvae]NSL89885.1 type IX secretion system outer membrane channel protein PorV [Chitinophaga solisilvae]
MIRKVTLSLVFIYSTFTSFETSAQTIDSTGQLDGRTNTINTAVPFLRITPDARSGAMGDVGVAIAPDASSIYWNLSKLPFAQAKSSLAVTYTPWLKELVNDVFLATVSGYTKLDEYQAISASLRYFSLGTINFRDVTNQDLGDFHPREFAFDAGYSRKLSEHFSVGLTGRYIYSNLAGGQSNGSVTIKPGKAFAADISAFYTKDFEKDDGTVNKLNFGVNISNIGTKISYTSSAQKDFIPTNLALGGAYTLSLDEANQLTFALDINKLLVPTSTRGDSTYKDKSVLQGIFSSFGDAPGGLKEELQELMYSVGMEYWYNQQFAVRAGYFNENKNKGNRKYFTAGIGIKYDIFGLNFSYLVPSGSGIQRNPLSNTLRFTLTFDLGARDDESRTGW